MKPPEKIPQELYNEFTLNGEIEVRDYYFDDTTNKWNNTITVFEDGNIKRISNVNFYSDLDISKRIEKVLNGKEVCYTNTDIFLYNALKKYPIENKNVLIMGSEQPSYESVCLAYKGKPTTVEYNKIYTDSERIQLFTVEEFSKIIGYLYHCAFSISSFEHDGLGRYGDPIDPYGDIKAMQKMKQYIIPNGLLYLAIPVGKDTVYWNGMRQYGKKRFPMLIEGWELMESFGFEESDLEKEFDSYYTNIGHKRYHYHQPVFVLRNKDE